MLLFDDHESMRTAMAYPTRLYGRALAFAPGLHRPGRKDPDGQYPTVPHAGTPPAERPRATATQ